MNRFIILIFFSYIFISCKNEGETKALPTVKILEIHNQTLRAILKSDLDRASDLDKRSIFFKGLQDDLDHCNAIIESLDDSTKPEEIKSMKEQSTLLLKLVDDRVAIDQKKIKRMRARYKEE